MLANVGPGFLGNQGEERSTACLIGQGARARLGDARVAGFLAVRAERRERLGQVLDAGALLPIFAGIDPMREARLMSRLDHPNIVQAYDVGKAGEFHYFVMEYVEGGTVHDTIVQNKRFDEKDALDIVINIADALQHAHEKGLIHRDVKPKNIMMTTGGVAKLADLGLELGMELPAEVEI